MTRRGGYVLVQTLVVIAALLALLSIMAHDEHANVGVVQTRLDARRADQAANAAIARAITQLQGTNTNLVTLNDTWAQIGQNGQSPVGQNTQLAPVEYQLGSDGPTFREQVLDASSLLNIGIDATTAAAQTIESNELLLLPLTQQQVDCLLDWTETSTTARSDGAKDSYYNGLPQPYNTRLGPMETVDELLLVDNWTAQDVYQSTGSSTSSTMPPMDPEGNPLAIASLVTVDSGCPNTQASGTARIAIATELRTLLGNQAPATLPAAVTSFQTLYTQPQFRALTIAQWRTLLNTATFTAAGTRLTGKINLNTAPQAVLALLPNVAAPVASAIVGQQSAGFATLGSLTTVTGLTNPVQVAAVADQFTVGSDTWIVRAYGASNGVGEAVEAVVRVTNGTAQLITWQKVNTPKVPIWWDWADSQSTIDAASNT